MKTDKTLKEFLQVLNRLNRANIDFLNGKDVNVLLGGKYDKELEQIQNLINTFDFVGPQPIDKKLLTHPVPDYVRKLFT